MFGALNRFISRLDAEPLPNNQPQTSSDTSFGFQVLRNTNPDLSVEPWFDFIIGLNGHYIVCPSQLQALTLSNVPIGQPRSIPSVDGDTELCRSAVLIRAVECKGPTNTQTYGSHTPRPAIPRPHSTISTARFDSEHLACPDHTLSSFTSASSRSSSAQ